jgi:hypothetical protein
MNAHDAEVPGTGDDSTIEAPIPGPSEALYSAEKESLEEGTRAALDELEQETMGTPVEEMTPEQLAEAANTMREGELNYLQRQTENPDEGVASRAEFILSIKEGMDQLIDEVHAKMKAGDAEGAHAQVKEFLIATRNDLEQKEVQGDDVERAITQMQLLIDLDVALLEAGEETRGMLLTLTSFGMDLIPFIGGLKMMAEGAAGKTLDGQDLEGLRRLTHASEGMLWEVVDVASVAAALLSVGAGGAAIQGAAKGAKVAKAAPRLSKVMTRSGAFMKANKVKGSKEVFKAGRVLQENAKLEKVAQKTFEKGLRQRTSRVVRAAGELPGQVTELKQAAVDQMEVLNEMNKEREQLTHILDEIAQSGDQLAA